MLDESKLEVAFYQWVDTLLSESIPETVIAYCFHVSEEEGNFRVRLTGANCFSREDEDWACSEDFLPSQEGFSVPWSYSGESWEDGLNKVIELVYDYLSRECEGVDILEQAEAVGVGFVDGDLYLMENVHLDGEEEDVLFYFDEAGDLRFPPM